MLAASYPCYIANEAKLLNTDLEVRDKYSGEIATRVPLADPAAIELAKRERTDSSRIRREPRHLLELLLSPLRA